MTQMKTNITGVYIGIIKGNVLSLHLLQACLQLGFFFGFFIGSAKKINVIEPRLTTVHL